METYNAWLRLPFVIATWNPRTGDVSRFLLAGGIPQRAVKDENGMSEWFTPRVWKNSTFTSPTNTKGRGAPPIRAVHDVALFPEDNLMELREKICLVTNIPIYRQHVFTIDAANGKMSGLYSIFTDSPIAPDIRNMDGEDNVLGMPIDRSLYGARDYIHITAGETFTIMSQWLPTGGVIWVVDLNYFTQPVTTQLSGYAGDKYMIDLIYWGFIAKYWPIMTHEVFAVYVIGEHNIRSAFPAISKGQSDLRRKHDAEREIILQRYSLAHKARTMPKNVSITQFTATVTSVSVHINIRNIFEKSRVSADVPSIMAYIDMGEGRKVRMTRSLHDAPQVEPPSAPIFMNGIVFAIQLRRVRHAVRSDKGAVDGGAISPVIGGAISPMTGNYMWLAIHPNGKYYIRSTWPEDSAIDFQDIYTMLDQHVTPVIKSINTMGRLVFNTGSALESVSRETVSFQGLNVSVSWKQPMTVDSFRVLRNSWDRHTTADIAVVRPTTLYDRVELTFRKGIYANDPAKIGYVVSMSGVELNNMYSYLSNPFIAKKWAQNYGGRTCSVSMRESDVRIDVIDIREDEFRGSFLDYMFTHLWEVMHSEQFMHSSKAASTAGRLVRRLRDTDPELFNMTKYGVTRKYSQICQGPRQPQLVTDLGALSDKKARSVVKYWNFTKGQPAMYMCPNPKFPHLSFITKMHPAGYCLPCCNKRSRDDEARQTCLRNHKWISEETHSEHVMAYGKSIPAGRFSQTHPGVAALFPSGITLASAEQPEDAAVPEWRIIYAAAAALGKDPKIVIKAVQNVIGDMYESFGESVAGRDKQSLIRELEAGPRAPGVDWIEIISTGINIAYSHAIIVFDDAYDNVRIRVPQSTIDSETDKFILVSMTQTRAYPIVDQTTQNPEFSGDVQQIRAILSGARKTSTRYMDIAAVRRVASAVSWKITKKYVNLQNLCYAVMLYSDGAGGEHRHVYLSITYSAHGGDGIPIDTAGFDPATQNFAIADLISMLEAFGDQIKVVGVAKWEKVQEGAACSAIIVHADGATLYCYYTSSGTDAVIWHGAQLPVVQLAYDPIHVTRVILSRKYTDPAEDELVGREQYRMSIYNMLVMHIGEKLREERNTQMRERIIAASRNPDDLMKLDIVIDGKTHGKLSATDMGIIRATLQFTGIKGLVKRLDAPFDFDMVTLMKIQSAETRDEAIKIIKTITDKITVSQETPKSLFPNIYTVCFADRDQPFCSGDKLIVDALDELLPILADDLRNPLRAATIFSEAWTTNVIDKMRFTRYGNDVIHS